MNRAQSKTQSRETAQENISIIQNGQYTIKGNIITIPTIQTEFIPAQAILLPSPAPVVPLDGKIFITDRPALLAAEEYRNDVAILNFASAKNPGGGFKNGSMAQEESLCYGSLLYSSLTEPNAEEYYKINRESPHGGIYNSNAVWSGGVPVIRDSDAKLINFWLCDIITLPAVNKGHATKTVDNNRINDEMRLRCARAIEIARMKNVRNFILGAYGCGVFKNDAEDVSGFFYDLLIVQGLRFHFKNIIFAIKGVRYNFDCFNRRFENFLSSSKEN
ncbi:MAG: TIGR02452 family protein [Defluviitaleaceae bacterium]|nr:TIGR02452 family protein [Defluviitaleaceae bacterium]